MATDYRIYGAQMSPYSVKVRSYFRYKGIPHRWIVRNAETEADYQRYAKIPIVPLVVSPDDTALQDSAWMRAAPTLTIACLWTGGARPMFDETGKKAPRSRGGHRTRCAQHYES